MTPGRDAPEWPVPASAPAPDRAAHARSADADFAPAGDRSSAARTRRSCRCRSVHAPADRVLQELERHDVADLEVIDGRALVDVGSMKEHVPIVGQADAAIRLTDEQLDDPPGRLGATLLRGTAGRSHAQGRRASSGAEE